jgi:hypothetical protein
MEVKMKKKIAIFSYILLLPITVYFSLDYISVELKKYSDISDVYQQKLNALNDECS